MPTRGLRQRRTPIGQREKQVTFRMTAADWEEMHVVTAVTGHTQRIILNQGFRAFVAALPAEDRRLIQSILTTRRNRKTG